MANIGAEAQAQEYIDQANKVANSFRLFNRSAKYEEASELYAKAAAQFKIAKLFQQAGDAYIKAAQMSSQSSPLDELNHYTNAAKCFKQAGNKNDAVRVFEQVVAKQQENNKFSVAAKLYKEIAELEETDVKLGNAITAYERAADCFRADDANTSANQMLLKVADLSAMEADYKRAIEIYEKIASESMDNNLTKYSVPEYYFKSVLCNLALSAKLGNDNGRLAQDALMRYKDLFAAFETSKECKFLEKLLPPFEERDPDAFADVVFDYDNMYKLDKWKMELLHRAKKSIMGDEEVDLK
jgi:alpha-soluble NSF attachment protein